jgi:hypothetical protein
LLCIDFLSLKMINSLEAMNIWISMKISTKFKAMSHFYAIYYVTLFETVDLWLCLVSFFL